MTEAERTLLIAVARCVTDSGLGHEGDRATIDKNRSAVLMEITYREAGEAHARESVVRDAESDWHPIETLPKDAPCDLWVKSDFDNARLFEGRVTNAMFVRDGVWSHRDQYGCDIEIPIDLITHWMPIANEPPK